MLDLTEEYTRVEERNSMEQRLKEIVHGTEYEDRISEIIELVQTKKNLSKQME